MVDSQIENPMMDTKVDELVIDSKFTSDTKAESP